MVRVIEPEIKYEIKCEKCGRLLGYEPEDVEKMGNEYGIYCPNCEEWVVVKSVPPFTFPEGFDHIGVDFPDTVRLSDKDIQRYVNQCVKRMKESQEKEDWDLFATGDTLITVFKDEESITCYVSKNYYETFEDFD